MPFIPEHFKTEADIDRFYHRRPKDDAWKQVTLSHLLEQDLRLIIACHGCRREKVVWPAVYAHEHGVPMETPLLTLARQLRCTTCMHRICYVWPEPYSIKHDRHGVPRE
ncbi:hypothetical protein [Hyphomicrobium sp. MC8b]|uniref:hypothetical protein n=1 Tax=Hyphomicrobium sp. MC8b TaxID=300273 RepID=UPI0039192157